MLAALWYHIKNLFSSKPPSRASDEQVQRVVYETNFIFNQVGISPVDFMVKQITKPIITKHHCVMDDTQERRQAILQALLDSGSIPKHKWEYLQKGERLEALNRWLQGDT